MKAVSFCFDDGFRASADKVRRIFSARRLSAAFCVLAAPELTNDPYIRRSDVADWGYWRETLAEGHEVAPHGFAHEHLGRMSFNDACDSVQRTLDVTERELPAFNARESIYHVAYVSAPVEVIRWIGQRSLGVRVATGGYGLNAWESLSQGGCVDCMAWGPQTCDEPARAHVERFVQAPSGWLVVVFHGLDGEGWGTLSSAALERMLDQLLTAGITVEPPNRVLGRFLSARVQTRKGNLE
jgi:peptidoglycan/xylan/chitin deacetylase (PgdA/CDA1 family)